MQSLGDLGRRLSRTELLTVPVAEAADGFRRRYAEVVRNACARILER